MTGKFADIIIEISHEKVDRPFQYRIPEALQGKLERGMCVQVPFGTGNRLRTGYVMEVTDTPSFDPRKQKEIASIRTEGVAVEAKLIALAGFIKHRYGSTMITALKTVLPAKQRVKKKVERSVTLTAGPEQVQEAITVCARKRQCAKERVLRELQKEETLPYSLLTSKLQVAAATLLSLQKAGLISISREDGYRNPVKRDLEKENRKTLSPQQRQIVAAVQADMEAGVRRTYLLHGITGSGKTEVYMALVEQVVRQGRQAIVLIPEIALTYQTVLRFYKRFGDRVSVMNSTLSAGEKYDQCERARHGEIDVIIGPRSALFVPFPNLGLIVIDEEQENSYKSESMPKYHAREVAEELARLHGASLFLGSATPSLEAYYRARTGEYRLFTLRERLTGGALPRVYTVDLREELRQGNRSMFSGLLQQLLADRLERGEQSMLFLNRRGYAGFVSCRACGHVMKCPHCDVSLSEHKGGRLVCHYCGYEQPAVKKCPACGSKYILGFRAGTQQIEEQIRRMYPGARVLRMDADTTRTKDSYERILGAFANREADILLGTQMIVKGHDFPGVTLVGILAADLSLAANDYRAGERTFCLLTQAAGRAGRGERPGEVVIQTYQPEHYSIVHAAAQDYEGFYEEEILYRQMLGYPPAAHILCVQIAAEEEAAGKELAKRLKQVLQRAAEQEQARQQAKGGKPPLIIGPAPAGVSRISDRFRFALYEKHSDYEVLVRGKDAIEIYMQTKETKGLFVQFDFDPINPY